jgi:hypothetical protein
MLNVAGETYLLSDLPDSDHPAIRNGPSEYVQQSLFDIDDKVITPWNVAEKLRPGTLINAEVELVLWLLDEKDYLKPVRVSVLLPERPSPILTILSLALCTYH